jgi:eukaryotic-like serine/threonine-protein kinase
VLDTGELLSGRYRLEELLGRGGMGEVWRATDLRLGRAVAIKACLTEPDARFTAEARVMASFHHPGIVNIYDYGDFYLVMEFVDGQPLSTLLDDDGPLDSPTTARLLSQVARALQVVHEIGIVHRDVKPSNILVDSAGNARLTDFGVAASGNGGDTVQGTARYMAPEQAMGYPVTPAADIYALGAVGYHCVAGFPPFSGEDAVEIALHHIQDAPIPLPEGTSPALRNTIARAMAKDPVDRFPSAAALARALRSASPAGSPSNMDKTVPERTHPLAPVEPRTHPLAPVEPVAPHHMPQHHLDQHHEPQHLRRSRRGTLLTIAAAAILITFGGLLLAANLRGDSPAGETPVQPPIAPTSTEPSPTPLGSEQVSRAPSPAPPRTAGPRPSPARTTVSPTPPESPPPPTTAGPTSPAPPEPT